MTSLFGGSNAFTQLKELVAPGGHVISTVSNIHSDGTATVTNRGGGQQRVRMYVGANVGDEVMVQEGAAKSLAPSLSSSSVSIG